MRDAHGFVPDAPVGCREFRIGCIGAGFIMADVQLAAYAEAGFPVVCIGSRTREHAAEVAKRWGIARVHAAPEDVIRDPEVEIVDLAFPPHLQPDLVMLALRQPHVKGILAQKPLALDLARFPLVPEEKADQQAHRPELRQDGEELRRHRTHAMPSK